MYKKKRPQSFIQKLPHERNKIICRLTYHGTAKGQAQRRLQREVQSRLQRIARGQWAQ